MARQRAKSFDAEIKEISRIADAVRAPDQLTLDELLPGEVHGHDRVQPTTYGYFSRCACGWQSREVASKRFAHALLKQHLGRTAQGGVLQRTLRKYGRSGSGA